MFINLPILKTVPSYSLKKEYKKNKCSSFIGQVVDTQRVFNLHFNYIPKWFSLLVLGLFFTSIHSIDAQSDNSVHQDSSMEYVHHQKESPDSLEVKVRGVYRAAKCDNPPLKIKYAKSTLKKRGLKKRNEYKLVYPCKNTEEYQHYIYKEYLIYKLYNELTDKSLRVHLIDFKLTDANEQVANIQNTGFIIEHEEEIIKRVDANKNDVRCVPIKKLLEYDYTLFQVFQFMIGNVDWIVENCKNVKVLQMRDSTLIPIPYDFDFTGSKNM